MDGISWANVMMRVASIPGTDTGEEKKEIDINNLDQYLNNGS